MQLKMLVCGALFAAGSSLCASGLALPDDSAASISAGGLVARRETRIVMAKEVLEISPDKVVVDYDFRNGTDHDVTTEVAFPVPPYSYEFDGPAVPDLSFSSFQLLAEGKRVEFQTEARATLDGKDVTAILTADKIDIPTLGQLSETDQPEVDFHTPDVERLPKAEQQRLVRLGLFGTDRPWGLWTVHLQYHWTQTFPAHSTVHIRHEYTPVDGGELMPPETLKDVAEDKRPAGDPESVKYESEDMQRLEGLCPDPGFLRSLISAMQTSRPGYGQYAHPRWVDFILTSANTWRQPIEDFTLIVDRGKPQEDDTQVFVSFCSPQNAPVRKLDAGHFQIHLTDFVPKSELRVGYFDVPESKSSKK
jgi:hypothetical protein